MKRPACLVACLFLGACDGDNTPPSFFDSGTDATTDATSDVATDAPDAAPDDAREGDRRPREPGRSRGARCASRSVSKTTAATRRSRRSRRCRTTRSPLARGAILPDLGVDLSQRAADAVRVPRFEDHAALRRLRHSSRSVALTLNIDYFVLPTIKNGTLARGRRSCSPLTGCLPSALDALADTTTCGADYNASKGNLAPADLHARSRHRQHATLRRAARARRVARRAACGRRAVRRDDGERGAPAVRRRRGRDHRRSHDALHARAERRPRRSRCRRSTRRRSSSPPVNPDGGAPPTQSSIPLPLVYEATTGQGDGRERLLRARRELHVRLRRRSASPTTLDGGAFNGYSLHALAFPNDPTLPAQ